MKIVADNLADSLRRPGEAGEPASVLLDTIGDALRALYSDAAADLPDALVALAERLDRAPQADAA